jgi:hypothetical protein
MDKEKSFWALALIALFLVGFCAAANAAEIIYQEDITQNLGTKDELLRTTFPLLVDTVKAYFKDQTPNLGWLA